MKPARCIACYCPLTLLRGERRRHCSRCGGGIRTPKATSACVTPGCAGTVEASRSLSGACVACRAKRSTLRAAVASRRRRERCAECDAPLSHDNLTGYCIGCAATAFVCRVDGCEARVAAFSVTRLCRLHNRSEVRRHYGIGRGGSRS